MFTFFTDIINSDIDFVPKKPSISYAIGNDDPDILAKVLQRQPDLKNIEVLFSSKHPPLIDILMLACRFGSLRCLDYLWNLIGNTRENTLKKIMERWGVQFFYEACLTNNKEVATFLLENGVEINNLCRYMLFINKWDDLAPLPLVETPFVLTYEVMLLMFNELMDLPVKKIQKILNRIYLKSELLKNTENISNLINILISNEMEAIKNAKTGEVINHKAWGVILETLMGFVEIIDNSNHKIFIKEGNLHNLFLMSLHYHDVSLFAPFIKYCFPEYLENMRITVNEVHVQDNEQYKLDYSYTENKDLVVIKTIQLSIMQLAIIERCLPLVLLLVEKGLEVEPFTLYQSIFSGFFDRHTQEAATLFKYLDDNGYPCPSELWLKFILNFNNSKNPQIRGSQFLINLIKMGVIIPNGINLFDLLLDSVTLGDIAGLNIMLLKIGYEPGREFINVIIQQNRSDLLEFFLKNSGIMLEKLKKEPVVLPYYEGRLLNLDCAVLLLKYGFRFDDKTQEAFEGSIQNAYEQYHLFLSRQLGDLDESIKKKEAELVYSLQSGRSETQLESIRLDPPSEQVMQYGERCDDLWSLYRP